MLWKKGKDNAQFLKRKFVLSEREFTLTYYNKENVSSLQLRHSAVQTTTHALWCKGVHTDLILIDRPLEVNTFYLYTFVT